MIPYEIKRSKRKTMGIYILPDGKVQVRCPYFVTGATVQKFVEQKAGWIEAHRRVRMERARKAAAFVIEEGSRLLLLGKEYPVHVGGRTEFNGGAFWITGRTQIDRKQELIFLYRQIALAILTEKAEHYGAVMGQKPVAVKITGAKTRWGSCSARGTINFSWRLILAEDAAVNSVVIHELAHLKELNHSARFWDLVLAYCPDYQEQKKNLSQLQARLAQENWEG